MSNAAKTVRAPKFTETQVFDAIDAMAARSLSGGPIVWAELFALMVVADEQMRRSDARMRGAL